MSTLKVEQIQHPSSSTPAISLHSSGGMSGSLPYPNRNLIYNGAMQVAQRGTSVTGFTSGGYTTADRWFVNNTSLGTITQDIQNDAPTGSGFSKSFRALVTTANSSPASNATLSVQQRIEGQDLQRLAKGTASAQELTLSFWVKANVTGTYIIVLMDSDNLRQVSASYTVDASATWEHKTITFVADTVGILDNDNAESLRLFFWLGAGTDRTSGTLRTTWTSLVTADLAVGQTNLAAAINNYWQITGVQLETGSVATEFEHETYGTTLAKCQRYYIQSENSGLSSHAYGDWVGMIDSQYTSHAFTGYRFPVEMRANPTITIYSGSGNGYADSYGRGQVGGGNVLADGISRRGFQEVYTSNNSALGSSSQAIRGGLRANAEL